MNLSETISNTVIIKSKNPHHSFVSIIPLFHEKNIPFSGISDKAEIDPSAKIGKDVSIAAFSVIGRNSIIENNVTIHPNVVVYNDCVIGENSIIHSGAHIRENCSLGKNSLVQNGAVIGSDGFGYIPDPQLGLKQVPQIGKSILKDHVDIGANACVDRGALGDTTIAQGTKIDNLVQVGHNVEIGNHSILCAHAAVGGSTKIGNQVVLGGCVGVADHVEIGNNVRMGGKTVVFYDVKEPGDYLGIPAMPAKQWQRLMVLWTKLPNIIKDMKSLKKLLKK
ncbi:UNVERIFIED_CONTAM: hypothetical protein GTU68_043447 [Idotea baltica]|nr:hypothetical protein [Idotea baltica]